VKTPGVRAEQAGGLPEFVVDELRRTCVAACLGHGLALVVLRAAGCLTNRDGSVYLTNDIVVQVFEDD
jgi:hypothetical protein